MAKFSSLLLASTLTGIGVGILSICFLWLIDQIFAVLYGSGEFSTIITTIPIWQRIAIPTMGGFAVGLLVMLLHRTDITGEGVPNVLESVQEHHSKLALVVAPMKLITAAITLGTGGSAGKEGPIVQIGATIGANIGVWTKQTESNRRLLLAAGAAAGIAGVFSAPLAGIVFSIELILKRFSLRQIVIIATAAAIAFAIVYFSAFSGVSFTLASQPAISVITLLLTIPLALLGGVLAVAFGFWLYLANMLFEHYPVPILIPSTLGGCIVGLISIMIPYIHEPMATPVLIDIFAFASLPLGLLTAIILAKIIATGVTLGSGGSGGVFAPTLLIGALLGAVYLYPVTWLGITDTGILTSLLLAAMVAFFAGVTHAPFTAAILLAELTGEPIVLPIVAAAAFIGYKTAKRLHEQSVYTEHLGRHGSYGHPTSASSAHSEQ